MNIHIQMACELLNLPANEREEFLAVPWWTPTLMATGRAARRLEQWIETEGLRRPPLARDDLEPALVVVTGRNDRPWRRAIAAIVATLPPPVRVFTRDTCQFLAPGVPVGEGRISGFAYPRHAVERSARSLAAAKVVVDQILREYEAKRMQTVEMPPLLLRADLTPETISEKDRTVDLIFSTGAPVTRTDPWAGVSYIEVLSLEKDHVRLDRLNDGGPVLDAHDGSSVRNQIGVVVPGTARIDNRRAKAVVQFSKRADIEPIWQDVRDGIVRNVSVGYRVHFYEETPGKNGKLPIRTAVDWEPYEISLVPMGVDPGAKTRSEGTKANTCVIVRREATVAQEGAQQAWSGEQWLIGFDGHLELGSQAFAWTVLEEIAHAWLGHDRGADSGLSEHVEPMANRLVAEWMPFLRRVS